MSQATVPQDMMLRVDMEVDINASPAKVFEAVLHHLGAGFGSPEQPLAMTLEAWPGGRWFRDLGDNQGHLWGHVQVIKTGKLLELSGPLFMSYPAINHLQFRISEQGKKSKLTFKHNAVGMIDDEHRQGVSMGWKMSMEGIKQHAESH